MCLVIGEHARRQRAAQHRTRVEVRPKRSRIRLRHAQRRVPVHDMLPKVVVTAQERLTHPQPNMLTRVWAWTTRPEARVDIEAVRILMYRRQALGPAQDLGRNIGAEGGHGGSSAIAQRQAGPHRWLLLAPALPARTGS